MPSEADTEKVLVLFRNGIRETIANTFGDTLKTVVVHRGTFGVEEIKRYGARSPACVVTINGGESERRGSTVHQDLKLAAFLITARVDKQDDMAVLLLLLARFLKLVHFTYWGFETDPIVNLKIATKVTDRNLYSPQLDSMAVSLWGITWVQTVSIAAGVDFDSLDIFRRNYVEYSTMQPTDEPTEPQVDTQMIELEIDE